MRITELKNIDLSVSEDGEPQTIISIRGIGTTPITLAVLIQDDLVPSVANEIQGLADFIRDFPKGSRVMIGYLRTGSLQVTTKIHERSRESRQIVARAERLGDGWSVQSLRRSG